MQNKYKLNNYSKDYMFWSIVNVILFLPHIYITLPNVFVSWLARHYNKLLNFKLAKYYSKRNLILNIVIGILFIIQTCLICAFLISKSAASNNSTSSSIFENSKIVTNKQGLDLENLIKLNNKKFKLLYQTSRDGFDNSIFHSKCDGVTGTLTVIKSKNTNIFGGYTSVDWSGNYQNKFDSTAFLFSLENSYNMSVKMIITQSSYAIYSSPNLSITFGVDFDLNCSRDQCSSYLGNSYQLPSFLTPGTNQAHSFLGGSQTFQIVEIEVYSTGLETQNNTTTNKAVTTTALGSFMFKNSSILTNEKSLDLENLIGFNRTDLKLLYKASRDGLDNSIFHSKCDGVTGTITVIKSKNSYIFGGYTSAEWSGNAWKHDTTAFLFSLVNRYNVSVKMNVTKPESAIYADAYYGIVFGGGCDLQCSSDQCSSYLGNSYQLPSFLTYNSNEANYFLGGSPYFQAIEIEVYLIDGKI